MVASSSRFLLDEDILSWQVVLVSALQEESLVEGEGDDDDKVSFPSLPDGAPFLFQESLLLRRRVILATVFREATTLVPF
ncbi:MAG: hypothetical protein LBF76_02625 [Holosporales bacterium]|nr:hypothetical protein [Holosporales bacterium]